MVCSFVIDSIRRSRQLIAPYDDRLPFPFKLLLTKHSIEEIDLFLPPDMRSDLTFGEEEGLPGIKAPMDALEAAVFPSDLDDPGETEEVDRRPAGLEDDQMGSDEEGRFAVGQNRSVQVES